MSSLQKQLDQYALAMNEYYKPLLPKLGLSQLVISFSDCVSRGDRGRVFLDVKMSVQLQRIEPRYKQRTFHKSFTANAKTGPFVFSTNVGAVDFVANAMYRLAWGIYDLYSNLDFIDRSGYGMETRDAKKVVRNIALIQMIKTYAPA